MSIDDCKSKITKVRVGTARANTLEAIARRWCDTPRALRKVLAGIRDPRLRADIQRVIDDYRTGAVPKRKPLPGERAEALAATCETLLRQFDDEQAGAAEIRLVVHKRDELPKRHEPPSEPGPGLRPDSTSSVDEEGEELVWELRRLLASSGGTIADVAHALERRGDDVDRKGRDLLEDEVRAVEADIAILKVVLSGPVDWDREYERLLAGEVPPSEDGGDDDQDDEAD
jgi:hypothetical protein